MEEKTNRKKQKGIETKGRISSAAFRLFLARGYDATGFSDIEQAAGATRGSIFHHFRDKQDLLRSVAEKFVIDFLQYIPPEDEATDDPTPLKRFLEHQVHQIEQRMQTFFEEVGSDSGITSATFMSFLLYVSAHVAGFKEKLREYETAQARRWAEVINQGKARGEVRREAPTDTLYDLFFSIYVGVAFHGAITHGRLALDELQRRWDFFYRAFAAN